MICRNQPFTTLVKESNESVLGVVFCAYFYSLASFTTKTFLNFHLVRNRSETTPIIMIIPIILKTEISAVVNVSPSSEKSEFSLSFLVMFFFLRLHFMDKYAWSRKRTSLTKSLKNVKSWWCRTSAPYVNSFVPLYSTGVVIVWVITIKIRSGSGIHSCCLLMFCISWDTCFCIIQ